MIRSLACFLVALTACSPAAVRPVEGTSPSAGKPGQVRATVVRVVDGDTIHVRDAAGARVKIRLIGIDTPETQHPRVGLECFGRESTRFTRDLLDGEQVTLRFDVERLDRYGRTLAYVFLADGRLANEAIVRAGYASVLTVPPNVAMADRFLAAQRAARNERLGLWRAC